LLFHGRKRRGGEKAGPPHQKGRRFGLTGLGYRKEETKFLQPAKAKWLVIVAKEGRRNKEKGVQRKRLHLSREEERCKQSQRKERHTRTNSAMEESRKNGSG